MRLTTPSMAFSIGTTPQSTSPVSTASSTSGTVTKSTSSAAARSAWVRTACSVNVPNGPKKPTREIGRVAIDREATSERRLWQRWRRGRIDAAAAPRRPRRRAHRRRRRSSPGCAGCPSPTSATPSSTTTAPSARACRRRCSGPGKTPEQCARIVAELLANGDGPVLVTRVSAEQVKAIEAAARVRAARMARLEAAGCLLYRAPEHARRRVGGRRHRRDRGRARSPTSAS